MIRTLIIIVSIVFGSTFCLPIDGSEQRVVNGTNTYEGEFPYIVNKNLLKNKTVTKLFLLFNIF